MAADSVPGKNLNLTNLDESLSADLAKIIERYIYMNDFPPTISEAVDAPTTVIPNAMAPMQPLEAVNQRVVDDDSDYRLNIAEYNSLVSQLLCSIICLLNLKVLW